MANPTFYHPQFNNDVHVITLSELESLHASKSRRLKVGDKVKIINGNGLIGNGEIAKLQAKQVEIQILDRQFLAQPPKITIASALAKGDRTKSMVDKLTQLGVTEFIPLNCERSVTKYKPSMQQKWQRIAIEACKQSQNPWLPKFSHAQSIDNFNCSDHQLVMFADQSGVSLQDGLSSKDIDTVNITALIGPEGGFSLKETDQMKKNALISVKLADTILRTELASITIAAQLEGFRTQK